MYVNKNKKTEIQKTQQIFSGADARGSSGAQIFFLIFSQGAMPEEVVALRAEITELKSQLDQSKESQVQKEEKIGNIPTHKLSLEISA
jgi:hypothetical protein